MFEHRTDMELGNMIVRSPVSMRPLSYLLKYSHHCSSAAYDAVMQTGILQGPPDTAHNTNILSAIWFFKYPSPTEFSSLHFQC